jgi:Tol biopolymer transport system component
MTLITLIISKIENIKKIKYAYILILLAAAAVISSGLSGCSSQIEGTKTEEKTYTGVSYVDAGITTSGVSMYFTRMKGSDSNIFLRDIAGTVETALTYDSNENMCVRGCSFGSDFLYSSNKSGAFRIYKITFENTTPVDLLGNPSYDFLDAAYSKNGQFVVLSAIDRADANYSQICMADANGENFKIITSTETLKRKPTVSADNNFVMFQKKVNGYWGLYYVDISAGDKVEKEYLAESNMDAFDPEFMASNAQSVSGVEEVIYMHGRAGSSARMERAYPSTKAVGVIRDFSSYYYFSQPAISNDGKTILFLQRTLSGSRFDIWKTSKTGVTLTQLTK